MQMQSTKSPAHETLTSDTATPASRKAAACGLFAVFTLAVLCMGVLIANATTTAPVTTEANQTESAR